ncbi:hypothetical protein [Sphingomonas jeddahensis]|uniref:Uncharacterized protein n=1 Tax=Sphingomonas jeddahensis TaxID=1915074 RepID=A0A1V2ESL6_9SPHN|nr:hypothetical protein [Sphingomonas jeddahensis]ONF95533.1 hypothetical protein SPHI_22000 [Sphingomonas jeddahensis]
MAKTIKPAPVPLASSPLRAALALLLAGLLLLPGAATRAASNAFDLAGPALRISVTHDGLTLPLSQVPNLSAGDRLRVVADLPADQGAHYRMVLAFLRGATNPPPKNWLIETRTWKPKEAAIDARVPENAQQAIVFLVPDTGGAFDAVVKAVRDQPGAFVRASQELNQAMLDRTRLETFLDAIRRHPPTDAARLSPRLAESLAIKLDAGCLLGQADPRAACLTQDGGATVLADSQTSSIAQTLAGAPANIALQLSATPQGGFGYYSAYIGVVRDLAQMLGAFQSAQLRFIPALGVPREGRIELLLNTAPSFSRPQSVLVAALPNVAPPTLPVLTPAAGPRLCLAAPKLVLPVSGAPLVFSTDYPRAMTLRVPTATGRMLDLPVTPDPAQGGFVVSNANVPADAPGAEAEGRIQGFWGFQPFDGPRFRFTNAATGSWRPDGTTLVVGRETPLVLSGGVPSCVAEIWLERDTTRRAVDWSAGADGTLSLKVPLADIAPGKVAILIRSHGVEQPQRLEMRAYAEVSRLAGFTVHVGDRSAVLTGTRLDQVTSVALGGVTFRPETLGRDGAVDRLVMRADGDLVAISPGTHPARALLNDGRGVKLAATVAPPRPDVSLVSQSLARLGPAPAVPLAIAAQGFLPQDHRLTFSLRAEGPTRFTPGDRVEIEATATRIVARLPVQLQDAHIAIASLDPVAALGEAAHGPLRFRLIQGEAASDWQPLTTLVRVPRLTGVTCTQAACVIGGTGLFLVRSIAGRGDVPIPDGFTGTSITVPRPDGETLALHLRDSPGAIAAVTLPADAPSM